MLSLNQFSTFRVQCLFSYLGSQGNPITGFGFMTTPFFFSIFDRDS